MKASILYLFIAAFAASFLASCNKDIEGEFWGKTNFYGDFLFKKYDPVIMEQTLVLDFNDDARRLLTQPVALEIVEKTGDNAYAAPKGVVIYKNGQPCPANVVEVSAKENEVKLGIEFTAEAPEGNHTLYIRQKGSNGLDRIDLQELTNGLVINKNNIHNPLALWLFWIGIVILALLLVWRIALRPMFFDYFKLRTLYISYPTAQRSLKINNNCYKVVCSKTKKSQSLISKFFTGNIVFEQNPFWQQDMEVTPRITSRDKRAARVSPPRGFTASSVSLTLGTDVEITDPNSVKVKLRIN